jgi:hypothetical protein
MILTQIALSAIKLTLNNLGLSSYLNIAPQIANYPFIVFTVISAPAEYTFSEVNEDIRIQFSVFDNNADMANIFSLANSIEQAFENFNSNYNSNHIICAHKNGEVGPYYNEKEHYYQVNLDYIFNSWRNKV